MDATARPARASPLRVGAWDVWPDAHRVGDSHVEPKAMEVLLVLAAEAPATVTLQTLVERVWHNVCVGDGVVHRAISHLRRVLGDDARSPAFIETVPRRGYRLICSVHRFQSAEVADAVIHGAGQDVLLAVLPFDNRSAEPELEYFSDGVSEEIIGTVARTTGVRVIGRSSSFRFRGADKSVTRIASELRCTHVLDGSVRRSGELVRVTAELVECASQTTLWSGRIERRLTDAFVLQDEIAFAVARGLALAFSPSSSTPRIDPLAYDLYLRARSSHERWLGSRESALLEQAVARAPGFAKAWGALAVTRAVDAHVSREAPEALRARSQAVQAANAALSLEPGLGEAYAALSIVEPICGRFAERHELISRALAIAPNDAVSLFWACRWSWAVGRVRESLGYIARAHTVDPFWPQGAHQYATTLRILGHYQEAVAIWDDAIARWPHLTHLYAAQLKLEMYDQNWPRVEMLFKAADSAGLTGDIFDRLRREAAWLRSWTEQHTARLLQKLERQLTQTGTIQLYLQRACEVGLIDDVYALLERATFDHLFRPEGRLHFGDYGSHALFARIGQDRMHKDRRFVKLCGRLGLCSYWIGTGRWPDLADELTPYYDFRAEAQKYVDQLTF